MLSITIPLFDCYPRIERFPCLHPHASPYTQSSLTLQPVDIYQHLCPTKSAASQISPKIQPLDTTLDTGSTDHVLG